MEQSSEIQRFPLSPRVFEEAERLGDPRAHRLRGVEIRVCFHYETGEPWFVAKDVCRILEIDNPSQAVTRLDDDQYQQVGAALISNEARPQDRMLILSESGLYSLILGSRKPVTRPFRRWVTEEVLPSIRKTGQYVEPSAPKSRVELARELLAAEERAEEAEKTAAEQRELLTRAHGMLKAVEPKVEAFDQLMDANGSVSLAQAAQLVGFGRQTLIDRLAEWKAVMVRPGHSDHLRPYQHHVTAGRFVVIAQAVPIEHRDGTAETLVKGTTRVTAKGVEWIRQMVKSGPLPLRRLAS